MGDCAPRERYFQSQGASWMGKNGVKWMGHAAALLLLLLLPAFAAAETIKLPIDLSSGFEPKAEGYLSENVYEDESIRVDIERTEWNGTKCYIARVKIADASQLRTAPAYAFNRNQTAPMESIAQRVKAVLAINGDYFSYQLGMDGGGYLVRQGVKYNDAPIWGRDVLLIDQNGDFYIEPKLTDELIAQYEAAGVVNTFNFGPGLVVNGVKLEECYSYYNQAEERAQRCAIAQVKRGELEYLCVVCEGSQQSKGGGMTIEEFADFVYSLGVENAYNLDGGNSSAMIFDGVKINAVDNKDSRPLSDIIYFASAVEE